MGAGPSDFVLKWHAIGAHLDTVDPWALLVGLTALAIIVGWPLVNRRVPSPFVALIATTAMVQLLHFPVETIGSRFGAINAALPAPALPAVTPQQLPGLLAAAFTIALLGAIESLLSAVVADGMIGGRHRSNMELVAQGVANIVAPLFGGIPATGAIARTATNVKNGGRTPVAGMTHALTLLLITLFFGRWAGLIPLATLAAILVVVAFHMSEWRTFVSEFRAPKSDVAVLLATFLLTVLVDLTAAIEVGMVLAAFLFMRRMAEVTNISVLTHEFTDPVDDFEHDPNAVRRRVIPEGVQVYEITGPFFFGAAETICQSRGSGVSRTGRTPSEHGDRMKSLGIIALALCCIAAPLAGQQDTSRARRPRTRPYGQRTDRGTGMGMDNNMMSMMREMMAPMMRVIAYEPEHLLARKDSLQLTNDQVTKLTTIQTASKSTHDAAANDVKTHMDELNQAFQTAAPDTNALRMHFDAAHAAMGKAHWAMLSAAAQARAVLTDAQRSKIDSWVNMMGQRAQREY